MTSQEKIVALTALRQECYACRACKLCENVVEDRDPHVFSYGNVDSLVIFIAEAPGEEETKQKKPLVGAAGRNYQTCVLDALNLTREQGYTTNVAKCRPPGNRAPENEEKRVCTEFFLKKEVEIVKPKYLVTMGNHALEYFCGVANIAANHGQILWSRRFQCEVFPLFHPAALLYDPRNREKMKEDVEKLKGFLKL